MNGTLPQQIQDDITALLMAVNDASVAAAKESSAAADLSAAQGAENLAKAAKDATAQAQEAALNTLQTDLTAAYGAAATGPLMARLKPHLATGYAINWGSLIKVLIGILQNLGVTPAAVPTPPAPEATEKHHTRGH